MPIPAILGAGVKAILGSLGGKIGDVIDQAVTDKDLANKLKHDIEKTLIDSTTQVRLQQEMTAQETERTHQAALNQSDIYTKRARPKIAIESWRLAIGYALLSFGEQVVRGADAVLSFDPVIFGTIAGPALWYMGMRGIEKTAAYWKGNVPDMQAPMASIREMILAKG